MFGIRRKRLFQYFYRLLVFSLKSVGGCQQQVDIGIRLIHGFSLGESCFCLFVLPHPEIDQTEVGITQFFIRCQLDEFLEFGFGLFQFHLLEICQAQGLSRHELHFHFSLFLLRGLARDQKRYDQEDKEAVNTFFHPSKVK